MAPSPAATEVTLGGGLIISTNYDTGSMASASLSGDVVTLRPRTYPFNNRTTSWWNAFRLEGTAGRTLTFRFNTSGLRLHGHHADSRYVISYDQESWKHPDQTSGSGNGYTFTHTFTQDVAWIAYGLPYPVSRVDAKVAEWAQSPWVRPTPSTNASLQILDTGSGQPWRSPGGSNDVGFPIPSHPLYALWVTDDRVEAPKVNVVLVAGNHSGEPTGNHVLDGLMDWLLSDMPRALALRRSANVFVYPMADPDGRYGGYSRCNQLLPNGDHNREWDIASNGTLPEIDALQEAMRRDTGAQVAFFLDIHNQATPDDFYMFVNRGWEETPFVLGMFRHFSPFRLNVVSTFDTRIARGWARASADGLNAANSFTMEPPSAPVTTAEVYHDYGVAMGCSLFDALVEPASYYLWAEASGLVGDDALPGSDPDRDGFRNDLEKAMGTVATNSNSYPVLGFTYATDGSQLTLTLTRSQDPVDRLEIEVSGDLLEWGDALEDSLTLEAITDRGDGYEEVTFRLSPLVGARLFFRAQLSGD